MINMHRFDVVIIGAGPYGLAAAAHLRAAGVVARVFGEVMGFWERQMPIGTVLRSEWDGSHFADPAGFFTLDAYEQATGVRLPERIPITDYVGYGKWFQRSAVPDVDTRLVQSVEPANGGFRLRVEDGEEIGARRVVVAVRLVLRGRIDAACGRPATGAGPPVRRGTCPEEQLSCK